MLTPQDMLDALEKCKSFNPDVTMNLDEFIRGIELARDAFREDHFFPVNGEMSQDFRTVISSPFDTIFDKAKNIQKEILDYSSCDDTAVQVDPSLSDNCAVNVDGTDSLQQSTMTNSESPSPKKDENNHEYSFSAASDDEAEFDNVEVNAALNDLKGPKRSET